MKEIILNSISEAKKKKVDRAMNVLGFIFLFLSIIGLGSKGGIPSFTMSLGSHSPLLILAIIIILLIIFMLRREFYKEGEISLNRDIILLRKRNEEKTYKISDLKEIIVSITDKEGFQNYIEIVTNEKKEKVFFSVNSEEDFYYLKNNYSNWVNRKLNRQQPKQNAIAGRVV